MCVCGLALAATGCLTENTSLYESSGRVARTQHPPFRFLPDLVLQH